MDWNKKEFMNVCKIVAFGIILYWILNNLSMFWLAIGTLISILAPFIGGAAFAFILNIPMTILEKKVFVKRKKSKKKNIREDNKISKGKRLICIFISLLIIILIIAWIIFLVIPEIIDLARQIISYLPELLTDIKEIIRELTIDYPEIEGALSNIQLNLENLNSEMIKELTSFVTSFGTTLITSSFGVITSTISMIVKTFVAIVFAFYILLDKEKIFLQLKRVIYAFASDKTADKICDIAIISKTAFYNFITGQFTECIILGSLCAIGMMILQLPYSIVVGVLVAITAFIPIVGAFIGGAVGVILLLPISLTKALIFLVFFVILQQIENNLIYPRVVGNRVGVPGILVLIAITIGSALGGILGMVIALPTTSVIYGLVRETMNNRLEQKENLKNT